jgi:hypothetical protein
LILPSGNEEKECDNGGSIDRFVDDNVREKKWGERYEEEPNSKQEKRQLWNGQ